MYFWYYVSITIQEILSYSSNLSLFEKLAETQWYQGWCSSSKVVGFWISKLRSTIGSMVYSMSFDSSVSSKGISRDSDIGFDLLSRWYWNSMGIDSQIWLFSSEIVLTELIFNGFMAKPQLELFLSQFFRFLLFLLEVVISFIQLSYQKVA